MIKKTKSQSTSEYRSMIAGAMDLPNILTYLRIAGGPMIVTCFFLLPPPWSNWLAVVMFITVAITDFLDGYLARVWSQQSAIGQILDPIADKLLVTTCLLLLTEQGMIGGWSTWAAMIILCREILVLGLRDFLSELRVSMPVTRMTKWKTTLQFVAIGILLSGEAGRNIYEYTMFVGLTCLWLSAIITLYTGYGYFRVGLNHLIKEGR